MPITFTIWKEQGFFVSTWVGDISDSDLQPSYWQLLNDEKYKPGFHEIVDLREANMGGITTEGFRGLSAMVYNFLAGKTERFKTAVIAPVDLSFGVSRIYQAVSVESPEEVKVFRNPNEAFAWVGVDESLAEELIYHCS